jgi:hypothetical protein
MQVNYYKQDDPFWLRYDGGPKPIEIPVFYDGGLEGGGEGAGFFNEKVGIRLLAPYPYWRDVLV